MYASVWKRQRDGTFKVVLDVGVPTPQAVPFAPGVQRAPSANRFSGDYDDRTPPLAAADGVLNSGAAAGQSRGYRGRLAPDARLHRPGVMPLVGEPRILAWLAGQPALTLGDTPLRRVGPVRRPGLHVGHVPDRPRPAGPAGPTASRKGSTPACGRGRTNGPVAGRARRAAARSEDARTVVSRSRSRVKLAFCQAAVSRTERTKAQWPSAPNPP